VHQNICHVRDLLTETVSMYASVSLTQFVGYVEPGSGLRFELPEQASGCILYFLKSVSGFCDYLFLSI